jgi:hypothetical protein
VTERYRSAEQLLERHIRDMGEDLGRVYNALTNEVSWLNVKWGLFRQLYAHSPRRIDLLNQAAGHFFGVLQCALIDDVLLHLGRLTDAESIGRRENLTIRRLPSLVPEVLRTEVDGLVTAAATACEPVRPWRNRRLAHTDLESAISKTPLPGIRHAQVDEALASFRALLNRIEVHFWQAPTMYKDTITPPGDADSLVYYLMKGIRADERRYQRLLKGEPLPEDLEREDVP